MISAAGALDASKTARATATDTMVTPPSRSVGLARGGEVSGRGAVDEVGKAPRPLREIEIERE